ncbi:MAG TPA: SRPBCC family protein [Jatrophihabitans sp.]|nr:SRPBCC family protein [Jatrophihabitans sp.]
MNVTERTFEVNRSSDVVLTYLADFGNAVHWDPGTRSCERIGDGPIEVGARWHNVSRFAGRETELEYRLDVLEPGHIRLIGENKTAVSTDDIRITPSTESTARSTITYRSEVVFHGLAKVAGPFVQPEFERLGDKTVEGITREVGKL